MFILLCLTVCFAPLAFGSVEPWACFLLQLSVFSSALFLLLKGGASRHNHFKKTLIPAALFIAFIGLLQLLRENPVNGPYHFLFTSWRPATASAVIMWCFYAALLFIVPQIVCSPQRFKRFLWVVFLTGCAVAAIGIIQGTGGENRLIYGIREAPGNPFGPFINRDHAANFLLMSAMCGFGLFFAGLKEIMRARGSADFYDGIAAEAALFASSAGLIFVIYEIGCRGALYSFALTCLVFGIIGSFFMIRGKKIRAAALAGLSLLLAGHLFILYNNPRLAGLEGGKISGTALSRLDMYKSGLNLLRDYPVFGTGLGSLRQSLHYYKITGMSRRKIVDSLHSDFLELFAETGLVGGAVFCAAVLGALLFALKRWKECRSFRMKALYGGAMAAVVSAGLHNCVEFGFAMPSNSLVCFSLLGLLASPPVRLGRHMHESFEEIRGPEPSPLMKCLAAAVFLALLYIPFRGAVGSVYYAASKDRHIQFYRSEAYAAEAISWYKDADYILYLAGLRYNYTFRRKPISPEVKLENLKRDLRPYRSRLQTDFNMNRLYYAASARLLRLGSAAGSAPAASDYALAVSAPYRP